MSAQGGHDVTPELDRFIAAYNEDDNEWWALACGHHQNLFEAAIDRMADAETALAGVNGGPGNTSFLPDGVEATPDEPKVRAIGAPAPASLAPPRTNGCWDCGRLWSSPGWVDAWIPDELWLRIAPLPSGRGYLCVHCITAALDRIGARDVPIELWASPYRRGGYADPHVTSDAIVAGLVSSLATRKGRRA